MNRVLPDTNIYGEMILDKDLFIVKVACKKQALNLIYGFSLIRNELRAIPKNKTLARKNLRVSLLSLYDELVGNHSLIVDEDYLAEIATKYHNTYGI